MGTRFGRILRYASVGVLGAMLGGAGVIVSTSIPGPDGVIRGCYNSTTGSLRVVSDASECRATELPIWWNQTGVAGPTGATGPTGPAGRGLTALDELDGLPCNTTSATSGTTRVTYAAGGGVLIQCIPPGGASFVLNVSKTGTGAGTVTSNPLGIHCGPECSASFDAGAVVTLSATAAVDSFFAGWIGSCSGTGSCVVTMDAAKSVTATFTRAAYLLTVMKTGTGSGLVTSNPAGVNCGATCNASFDGGAVVTLTATPDAQSAFTGWSGACSGTGTCTVTMDSSKSVAANFARLSFTVTVSRSGAGTVTSVPVGIYCGFACSAPFDAGTTITLTATPDAGWALASWGIAGCVAPAPCTFVVTANVTVPATFVPVITQVEDPALHM